MTTREMLEVAAKNWAQGVSCSLLTVPDATKLLAVVEAAEWLKEVVVFTEDDVHNPDPSITSNATEEIYEIALAAYEALYDALAALEEK